MTKNDYIIRPERKDEHRKTENLVREAFWNVYRPGCSEHYVCSMLRQDDAFVSELDLVMEKEGNLIGQIMFMRAFIKTDDGKNIPVLTFGPLGISPEFQKQGYGKKLLNYALEKATAMGFGAVLIEGNIDFYSKSGFSFASKFGIRYHGLPENADSSFFLCKELTPKYLNGIVGEYSSPKSYSVNEKDVEAFDKNFPYKEKLKLPGQLF